MSEPDPMPSRAHEHDPAPHGDAGQGPPRREADRGWRTARIGVMVFIVSVVVVLSPLVGRYPGERFVVFAGLLAMCVGISCMLLGVLDRILK